MYLKTAHMYSKLQPFPKGYWVMNVRYNAHQQFQEPHVPCVWVARLVWWAVPFPPPYWQCPSWCRPCWSLSSWGPHVACGRLWIHQLMPHTRSRHCSYGHRAWDFLTHWGRDKMAPILQTIWKLLNFIYHWNVLLGVWLTIWQHWFR